jgi:hypothetical protein
MKKRGTETEILLKRRAALAAAAPDLREVLRGTLRSRFVRCGKSGCHCRKGRGHGPFFYLSVAMGVGRTIQIVIPSQEYPMARGFARNYRRLRQILERVSAINRQLLRQRTLLTRPSGLSRKRVPRSRRS